MSHAPYRTRRVYLRRTDYDSLPLADRCESLSVARDAGSEAASDHLDGIPEVQCHRRQGYLSLPADDPRRLAYLRTYREALA